MISEEEFKSAIVRMWDSLRETDKGKLSCSGITCNKCPFSGIDCSPSCNVIDCFEFIKIVEEWNNEHPVKTNANKFEEIFGFRPLDTLCPFGEASGCEGCKYCGKDDCTKSFWNDEYKEGGSDNGNSK